MSKQTSKQTSKQNSKHKIDKTTNFSASNRGYDRMDRIADLMHRSIAKLLREEFKDPRVQFVTVAFVKVSRDLAHAKVYITVLDEQKTNETIKILNAAAGFFRSQLARMMSLRVVPKPQFIFDESILRGSKILSLIEKEVKQVRTVEGVNEIKAIKKAKTIEEIKEIDEIEEIEETKDTDEKTK